MFKSPYNTTVCKNHVMRDIESDVRKLLIEGGLRRDMYNKNSSRVFFVDDSQKQIKPFAHPLVLENAIYNGTNDPIVVTDLRSCARVNRETNDLMGGSDFEYMKLRSEIMDVCWIDGNQQDLLNAGDFQVRVFARLIADNIGQRMNLEMETQLRVQIIAAYYYICLFYTEVPNDESDKLKIIKRISRSVQMTVPRVMETLEDISPMQNISDFCKVLGEKGNSVRLEKLTPGLLYTMLGGVWFGANTVENVAVALEHPPTFTAMLYMVTTDRGYRKTILGQICQRLSRDDLGKTFTYHLSRMVAQSE